MAVPDKTENAKEHGSTDQAPTTETANIKKDSVKHDGIPATGVRVPFAQPVSEAVPSPQSALTPDQKSKYDDLLSKVSSWEEIPDSAKDKNSTSPIKDAERMWLSRECLLRYLRASKWQIAKAADRILDTLTWRRDYGFETNLTPEKISVESETGKQMILGFDNNARPILYMHPARQNTQKSPRQIQHLVFMLERAIDLMGPGQEKVTLLINFKDSKSGQNANIAQGRETLYILQNHYPERLGRAFVLNGPWFFSAFFRVIYPFIDVDTREKIKFNENMRDHVPPQQLIKDVGGDVDFEYDHAAYWPELNKIADQRRHEQVDRWKRGGKKVGELESYLKGGQETGLAELEKVDGAGTAQGDKTDAEAATGEASKSDGAKGADDA